MKPIVLYCFFAFSLIATNAQQYESDLQFDTLLIKLHDAINLQKEIEIQEIKGVYRITPWHFVPSLNYDFINNRYYVTISSGPLVTNMINKRQEKRRLSALERRYNNQIKTQEIKLKSLIFSLNQRIANIQLSYEILLNDIEIYKIQIQEHANNEIDTETFLKEKSAILNKIKSHNKEISDIQSFLYDIEQLTEFEINIDIMKFYVSASSLNPPNNLKP